MQTFDPDSPRALTAFDYHEALHGTDLARRTLEAAWGYESTELILATHPDIATSYEAAIEALVDLYQAVGRSHL